MLADTLIVGAGPAGLAVGAALRRKRLPCTILERDPSTVGSSWRRHYDRLHLHTPKRHSALPFLPYPVHYPRYPSRSQVVDYLDAYARAFDLVPRYGENVVRCRRAQDDVWTVDTETSSWQARNLVIATGFNRLPVTPSWPGQASFPGPLLHSYDYRNGASYRGKRVLVVGFGNSGAEIATDLHEHGAESAIAMRSAVNIVPRDILGLPSTLFALASQYLSPRMADAVNALVIRLSVGDLRPLGIRKRDDGPFVEIFAHAHVPIVDVGALPLIRQRRIALRPGIERFEGGTVCFSGGSREHFDAVILATGFDVGLRPLFGDDAPFLDRAGRPTAFGRQAAPGLWFCGYRLTPTGFLREIGLEALRIGGEIAATARRQ